MRKDDVFSSERLCFRGINESDTDCLVVWRSDPEVIRYFTNPTPLTRQSHIQWFQNDYMHNNSRFDFVITEKSSNAKIGTVGIKNILWPQKTGEIMYAVAEKRCRRQGYATEAISALLRYIQPDIVLPYAVIHVDNIASIRTITAVGFELDSGDKQQMFVRYRKENL